MRFIDAYDAIFFDMNGTFMFGHDRLGEAENFFATYQQVGGTTLTADQVHQVVTATCDQLLRMYHDPAHYDSFPTLREVVATQGLITERDIDTFVSVIAHHEVGQVPDWAAQALRDLAATHRLAVVSNIWAPAQFWLPPLRRSGILDAFEHMAFSSSYGSIKPSPRMFLEMLATMRLNPSQVLFVGDSRKRDIVPAVQLGMAAVQVSELGPCSEATFGLQSIAKLAAQ